MQKTSFTLDPNTLAFADSQVERGMYGSRSDVIRAGLRLLQEHQARIDVLRAAIEEGENSGEPRDFDMTAFLADRRKK